MVSRYPWKAGPFLNRNKTRMDGGHGGEVGGMGRKKGGETGWDVK